MPTNFLLMFYFLPILENLNRKKRCGCNKGKFLLSKLPKYGWLNIVDTISSTTQLCAILDFEIRRLNKTIWNMRVGLHFTVRFAFLHVECVKADSCHPDHTSPTRALDRVCLNAITGAERKMDHASLTADLSKSQYFERCFPLESPALCWNHTLAMPCKQHQQWLCLRGYH